MFDAINRAIVHAYVGLKREEGQTFVEYSLHRRPRRGCARGSSRHLRGSDCCGIGNIGDSLK